MALYGLYKKQHEQHTIIILNLIVKGRIIMDSNQSNTHNKTKQKPVAQPSKQENIPNDPPGVLMPSEKEMSPPQYG